MKILYITNHLNGNDGWSRYSLDIINKIVKSNDIFCLTGQKSKVKNDYEKEIFKGPLQYLSNPIKSYSTAREINKIISEFSPDVIHFMVEPYITVLPFLKIKKNVKIILTIHGTYSYFPSLINNLLRKGVSSYLYNKALAKVDKIISVSNFTKDYFLNKKVVEENNIIVITNGVDLNKISERFQKRDTKKKEILFVGAIKPRKGILESVEALKYYRDNISDNFVYNILGYYDSADIYFKEIIRKIKKYNLENNIFFRGEVDEEELISYYKGADLFLMLPVRRGKAFEGFGLVYLEANAYGTPCIGSDNFGSKEAIKDSVTGYLVNPMDNVEIAKKIDLILNKTAIDNSNCLGWAKKNSISNKVKRIVKLYE